MRNRKRDPFHENVPPREYKDFTQENYSQTYTIYQQTLGSIVSDHTQATTTIARDYNQNIDQWSRSHDTTKQKFNYILTLPGPALDTETVRVGREVTGVINAASQDFFSLLIPHDQAIFTQVQAKSQEYGSGHYTVSDALLGASRPIAEVIIRAAGDSQVWNEVQAMAHKYGSSHYTVNDALLNASSGPVRQAMKAGLDNLIWKEVQALARAHGGEHYMVNDALLGASSPPAAQAMKAGLNNLVWHEVQALAQRYGGEHYTVNDALLGASSQTVRKAMRDLLPKPTPPPPPPQTTSSPFADYLNYDFSPPSTPPLRNFNPLKGFRKKEGTPSRKQAKKEHQQQIEDLLRERQALIDEMLRQLFQDTFGSPPRSGDQHQTYQHAPNSPPHARTKAERDALEVRGIITKAVAKDKSVAWLHSSNPRDVRRVVNSVRQIRTQAEEKGEIVSDRQIYLRYRRAIEKEGTVEGQLKESFTILDALMGNNPNGQLPF